MDRATIAEVETLLAVVWVVMIGDYACAGEEVADPSLNSDGT